MHFSSNVNTAIGEKPTGLEALFSPLAGATEAPAKADSSLSPEVNGKIIYLVFNVTIEGTFEQTESIIRDIERMQPLLIVRDYQSTLAPMSTADAKGQVGSAIITTSFQLQALMPVSVELATQTSTSSAVNQHQNKRW